MELVDREQVAFYLKDLRSLLGAGTVAEQRMFLKTIVERIEKQDSEATIYYTLPVPAAQIQRALGPLEVLNIGHYGSAYGFEPVISALRGRCPRPLDECAFSC